MGQRMLGHLNNFDTLVMSTYLHLKMIKNKHCYGNRITKVHLYLNIIMFSKMDE